MLPALLPRGGSGVIMPDKTPSPKAVPASADIRQLFHELEQVFKHLKLDPKQAEHWQRLREIFTAGGHFARRRPGRPAGSAKWTIVAYIRLAADWLIATRWQEN